MAALLYQKDIVLFDEATGFPLHISKVRKGPLCDGEVSGFGNGRVPGAIEYRYRHCASRALSTDTRHLNAIILTCEKEEARAVPSDEGLSTAHLVQLCGEDSLSRVGMHSGSS